MKVELERTTPCESCGEPMIWVKTEKGKPMPLDAEPRDDGNIRLRHDGVAVYMKRGESTSAGLLYVSHFATCPHAKKWRKP